MTRSRLAGLLGVLLAVVAALAYGVTSGGATAQAPPPGATATPSSEASLAPLRARAALAPCPGGLGLELELTLPCLGGGAPVALSAAASGVPTLVNVYASWCAPCQDEMPLLKAFHDRAGEKVGLVGVDTQDDRGQALHFAVDFQQHWPALVDDDGLVLRKYGSGPPLTLFVDGSGKVVHVQRGALRSGAQLDALVEKHLGVTV